jgi:hypothetical protein
MATTVRTIAKPTAAIKTIVTQFVKFHVMTLGPSIVSASWLQQDTWLLDQIHTALINGCRLRWLFGRRFIYIIGT